MEEIPRIDWQGSSAICKGLPDSQYRAVYLLALGSGVQLTWYRGPGAPDVLSQL